MARLWPSGSPPLATSGLVASLVRQNTSAHQDLKLFHNPRITRPITVRHSQVDPNDPSEAQRIAYKYARKENQHARFYNKKLRLVSAAQCVRAAMDDGSNTVLMSLGQDLVVTRAKVAEVAEMLNDDAEKRAANDYDYDDEIL